LTNPLVALYTLGVSTMWMKFQYVEHRRSGEHPMETREPGDIRVGVLDKAMSILLAFPRSGMALTPQELAARTGLPLPTVYRLAQALCDHGMLMKDGPRFRLGITLLRLGMLVAEALDVRKQALPHLQWLNAQTGENAELHIRQGDARMVLEMVSSPHNLRPFADIGAPIPLHRGAAGKVLLTWLSPDLRASLLAGSTARFDRLDGGEADGDAPSTVAAELDEVRARGWAISSGERSPGVSAIAAPVFDAGGQVIAALALVAPTARLGSEQCQRSVPLVCEAARRTSYDMGYTSHE
jgi:IclR family acetate operon transcriptional repressor